jgi:hypothetical protein
MLRADAVPDDLVVVVRAAPASVEDAINDIAVDALESGQTYVVQNERGEREPLFGVSVFALRAGVPLIELLSRFDEAPSYLEAQVGALQSARFVVLPTGANVDHFDVQLLSGQAEVTDEPAAVVWEAAARLVAAAGALRPNPAYSGGQHPFSEGQ